MRAPALACALSLAAFVAGCDSTCACDKAPDGGAVTVKAEYPPGPYGTQEGEILSNFAFQGLVNEKPGSLAKDADWAASYSVGDLRSTGAKYALIHVSAIGDAASEAAAAKLVEDAPGLHGQGAQIVEVLATAEGTAASEEELRAWVATYEMSVTAVVDSPDSPLTVFDAAGSPESGFIIKIPEMEIQWFSHGGGPQYTTVQDGIHWLHSLLAE
jgi:hypothetical protein